MTKSPAVTRILARICLLALPVAGLGAALATPLVVQASTQTTTDTTAGETAYSIPANTISLQVTLVGSHGSTTETGGAPPGSPGAGAELQATIPVPSGVSTLYLEVGAPNAGGVGTTSAGGGGGSDYSAGGGGASDVQTCSVSNSSCTDTFSAATDPRLLVAGGGGGGGEDASSGGAVGGAGGNAGDSTVSLGGGGGGGVDSGNGGAGQNGSFNGQASGTSGGAGSTSCGGAGANNSGAIGGAGEDSNAGSNEDGGGGGGGWIGGAGGGEGGTSSSCVVGTGAGGGGGGGRSYAEGSATSASISIASVTATPEIVIVATIATPPAITSANTSTFTTGTAGSFTVTATGTTPISLSESGSLPSGVAFIDNGNGTGTLSGTPGAGTGGAYPITFQASNGYSPNASQTFTLDVDQAPAITSAASTAFADGTASSFTVQTTGFPTPVLSTNGQALPAGISFTDNGNGTATISGTPASDGTYNVGLIAANGIGTNATQAFTLTVTAPPAISSATATTFQTGQAGTFTVETAGYPAPSLSDNSATLPSGVTFVDNGNGTATLAGTPGGSTGGSYSFTITASNGVSPDATQTFILTVDQAPAFTTAANTAFTAGAAGTFAVAVSGYPAGPTLTLTESGTLPSGVTFADNGNSTGTLSGTPAATSGGTYDFTLTASNGVSPEAIQSFVLTVNEAPTITSTASTTFTVGTPGSFTVTTNPTAYPTPAMSESGTLPGGVSFSDNGNGTATLSGTPTAGSGGVYTLTLAAHNGVSPNGTQTFTLSVDAAPHFSSADTATFTVGTSGLFTVATATYPTPTVSETGTLPSGVTFTANANGTGTLSGTPAAGTGGSYALILAATNGVSPNASQDFTLIVDQAPAITSAATTTFAFANSASSFIVTTTGHPVPSLSETGALPSGVSFADNSNGTATIAGPAGQAGSFSITITASNGTAPDATQDFTLQVSAPPPPPPAVPPTVPVLPITTPTPPGTPPAALHLDLHLAATSRVGGRVLLRANFSGGQGAVGGTVAFYRNGRLLRACASRPIAPGTEAHNVATCSVVLIRGTWQITARYTANASTTAGDLPYTPAVLTIRVTRTSAHPLHYTYRTRQDFGPEAVAHRGDRT